MASSHIVIAPAELVIIIGANFGFENINRYRTVCRIRAMRILALEFFLKMSSGVTRGAERNVHERDTQFCGEFFSVLYRLRNL